MADRKQFYYWFLRGYWDSPQEVMNLIGALDCRHYAFIYHDKDVYTDSTENHNAGDIKKPHYHILINLSAQKSWKALRKDILSLYPSCGIWCHDLNVPDQALLYLTHETEKSLAEEGKAQYDRNLVFTDDYSYFGSKVCNDEVHKEHQDYSADFFFEIISNGYISRSVILQYAAEHGRDFIFNLDRIIKAAEITLHRSLEVKDD